MKKTSIIFAGVVAGIGALAAKAIAHNRNKASAKALDIRAELLTNPTCGSREFAKSVKEFCGDKSNAVKVATPFAKDIFELGYTLGRRDEVLKQAIDSDEQEDYIDSYFDELF